MNAKKRRNLAEHLCALVTLAIGLCACQSHDSPPIGRDLPKSFTEAGPVFDARVKKRFPVGSSEGELVAELKQENFEILSEATTADPSARVAEFDANTLVCNLHWQVAWTAVGDRISSIEGRYGSICS